MLCPLLLFNCTVKNETIEYNNFDTFTLTPNNIEQKECAIKVVCNYSNGRLSAINYLTANDSVILKDTIYYNNGEKFHVHSSINIFEKDAKKNKLKKIRYIDQDVIRELVFSETQNGKFELKKVNELRKDNTLNYMDFNIEFYENKLYNSIESFLSSDLKSLRVSKPIKQLELIEYTYNDNCKVGVLCVHYNIEKNNTIRRYPCPKIIYYKSLGECLYIDSLSSY
jgi:hypothetical protein